MSDDWRDIEDVRRARWCEDHGHRFDDECCVMCGEEAPVDDDEPYDPLRDAQHVHFDRGE